MDFDSIIPLLFLFVFFILPSIFKQVIARKKKTAAPKKNPSIFDRIIEQVRQFVRDLEEQARQQKKGADQPDNIWDALSEDQSLQPDFEPSEFETREADADFDDSSSITPDQKEDLDNIKSLKEKSYPGMKEPVIKKPTPRLSGFGGHHRTPLQNAIIWSEILSKPVALRKNGF